MLFAKVTAMPRAPAPNEPSAAAQCSSAQMRSADAMTAELCSDMKIGPDQYGVIKVRHAGTIVDAIVTARMGAGFASSEEQYHAKDALGVVASQVEVRN